MVGGQLVSMIGVVVMFSFVAGNIVLELLGL